MGIESEDKSILNSELVIKQEREHLGVKESEPLFGLALSGGGIRSAIFSLGVMQALAKNSLLEKVDYLSTVSGGGYIGSAITWFLKNGYDLGGNFPFGTEDPKKGGGGSANERLEHLRRRGNYLTPDQKINSLSLLVAFIRGVLLNLMVWFPIFVLLMIVLLKSSTVFPILKKLVLFDTVGPGDCNVLFNISFIISIVFASSFLLIIVFYSLVTGLMREKAANSISRYWWRQQFDKKAKLILRVAGVFFIVGSLPLMAESAFGEVSGGLGAVLLGLISGIWTFVKSGTSGESKIPISATAPIGASLLIYGIFLLAYHAASQLACPFEGLGGKFGFFVISLIVSLGTGAIVNLNNISMHRYYRDRLMEAFMPHIGSSTENVEKSSKQSDTFKINELKNQKPYHIVNTNVVLVDSTKEKMKKRGGDNFILSPLFCGSTATKWCETESFMKGNMTLATAMAISGAAANPNTGVGGVGPTRNKIVSLLMALLNLRLGYWVRNPSKKERLRYSPNHFTAATYEIFPFLLGTGGYRETYPFLQLSDGGHFENLGIYELIRRRCKLIIACDGGADPKFAFGDLINARERIKSDFGTDIEFGEWEGKCPKSESSSTKNVRKNLTPSNLAGYPMGVKLADQGYMVGKIIYPPKEEKKVKKEHGYLILLKTTMTKDLSLEIMEYKGANPNFPDQSTADQFFDEKQFEAYRELGYKIAEEMIGSANLAEVIREKGERGGGNKMKGY